MSWDEPMTFEFQWEQPVNRHSESCWDSEQQWSTGRDVTAWTLPRGRFFDQNFWCSTDTQLPKFYRHNDIIDDKTDCSCIKVLFGRLIFYCDVSRAVSHPSLRWNCIRTLKLAVIYFYSCVSCIAKWPIASGIRKLNCDLQEMSQWPV